MLSLLRELRKKVAIGVVGGSDLVKISEQLSLGGAIGVFLTAQCQHNSSTDMFCPRV